LVAEPAHEVEGFARRLLVRESRRVLGDVRLHRFPHLRRRAEESVGWHEPGEPLVRPLEVVAVDEEPEPLLTVCVVREDGLAQPLVPQRLPEALHLAERLRMLRAALHVTDAVATKLLLEVRLAPPRCVLPALVRQHLLGCTEGSERASERFHHERGPLVVRERPADDEARVVVHERRQVQALVASKQKREDVRLP